MKTIGITANVYNEAAAITGWLESAAAFFDHISVVHAGPQGEYSNDGTIEILEKWKIPIVWAEIDKGFGEIRTLAIRSSPCDFVAIMDADERFHRFAPMLTCSGESTPADVVDQILQQYDCRDGDFAPSNWENLGKLGANLKVSKGEVYDQGAWLRKIIEGNEYNLDAIKTIRRHWHNFSWQRPTQNWHLLPDFQSRIVRNCEEIYFSPDTKMHERLIGAKHIFHPEHTRGPYFDHYHLFFKQQAPGTRRHAIKIYDAIHEGKIPPKLGEI